MARNTANTNFLKYSFGIPEFVQQWRPKMPSRNWMIFWSASAGLVALYGYDRYETRRITNEYKDLVHFMREDTVDPQDIVNSIHIIGTRDPGDHLTDRSSTWFKRWVKPVLVSAGADFSLLSGSNPGAAARSLIYDIRSKRLRDAALAKRADAGLPAEPTSPADFLDDLDRRRDAEFMRSGVVAVLGREALKEYLYALKKGYHEPIDLVQEAKLERLGYGMRDRKPDTRWDREQELLVRELEKEDLASGGGPFDELEDLPYSTKDQPSVLPPYAQLMSAANKKHTEDLQFDAATPLVIPALEALPDPFPPMVVVPYSHPVGWRTWIFRMAHFWNHRADARAGGESALQILAAHRRPIVPPNNPASLIDEAAVDEIASGKVHDIQPTEDVPSHSRDLDALIDLAKSYYVPRGFRKLPRHNFEYRNMYYGTELKNALQRARDIQAGAELTKREESDPPKTETALRNERVEKELQWRRDQQGWAIQRPGSGIAWVPVWDSALTVLDPATDDDRAEWARRSHDYKERLDALPEYTRQNDPSVNAADAAQSDPANSGAE